MGGVKSCWLFGQVRTLEPTWQRTRIYVRIATPSPHATTSRQRSETASRRYNSHSPGSSSRYTSLCCSATAPARPARAVGEGIATSAGAKIAEATGHATTTGIVILGMTMCKYAEASLAYLLSFGICRCGRYWISIVGIAFIMQRRPSYNQCNSDHRKSTRV